MKYVALDVHQDSTVVCARSSSGKIISTSIHATTKRALLAALRKLRGPLSVVIEEGALAAWLYATLRPHVAQMIVCDSRLTQLLRTGSKTDRIDASKLSELLRLGALRAVYHGDAEIDRLRLLVYHYEVLVGD